MNREEFIDFCSANFVHVLASLADDDGVVQVGDVMDAAASFAVSSLIWSFDREEIYGANWEEVLREQMWLLKDKIDENVDIYIDELRGEIDEQKGSGA